MSKWQDMFDSGTKPEPSLFVSRRYRVHMHGWTAWLFIPFVYPNIKRFNSTGEGLNVWAWKWGLFRVWTTTRSKEVVFDYNDPDNHAWVRRVCDWVRKSRNGTLIGMFRFRILGKCRWLGWFTLEPLNKPLTPQEALDRLQHVQRQLTKMRYRLAE